ncbi:carbon monoxide dehydrogenase [Rhodospirillaceae bacterium KN72]|uniref:Carbon monoxide dehydrogenase n=1 Tax=Pacificispira spongiicola TaxID=2729598 RepID=A0A7Y0DXG6_9PROT|nr:FAD binding domain-containing protein [Pacificispira spongiicola]NMM43407.1 carbon monoxide dehydrogenase [Pacificispira spongiicola]
MKPVGFTHSFPDTGTDAAAALKAADTKIISGGQSLGPMLNLRLARPASLVDIGAIAAFKDIRIEKDTLIIGAAVTHARIEDGDSPVPLPAMMRSVAHNIAYRAVRNRGTIGGSLAHADPAADWVTTMTAIGAELTLVNAAGERRQMAMGSFMHGAYRTALNADEIIESVSVPVGRGDAHWGYYKVCRKVGEFADAIGAAVFDPTRRYARIVVGATGGAPLILDELAVETARSAMLPKDGRIEEILARELPDADRVKRHLLATATRRALEKVLAK